MAISKLRGTRSPLLTFALILGFAAVASTSEAVDCGTKVSQNVQSHPRYSGTLPNLLSTGGGDSYIYGATTWGYVRASLANPSNPGPLALIQIGLKTVLGGTNGGLIYMNCDCNQGASVMAAAEASDGSSRIISNWIAPSSGVLRGMVATTSGGSDPAFGAQIDVTPVSSSSGLAAVYMAGSNKYYGYFPAGNIQIVDLTNPSNSTSELLALKPIGTFGWAGVFALKSGKVTVPGQGTKTLLAAYLPQSRTLRVAEIDNSGTPVEKASIAANGPNALAFANVSGKAYVFSADNSAGLNVYEYTGSSLVFAGKLTGTFTNVVVKGSPGSPFPAVFVHRSAPTDAVDIYDSKWVANGTAPIRAYSLPHQNSLPPTGRGDAIEAVVTTNGNQIIAHVYRLATTTNPQVNPEHLLVTDNIDISCIAADPTSKPIANATYLNLTAQAQSRVGTNYYGDLFQLTDSSSTGSPMTSAAWDINTNGLTFGPDPNLTALSITGYFPCDPSAGQPGIFANGVNCGASVGLPVTPGTQSFRFGEKSSNINGQSDDPPFFSGPIQFVMPQISIAGFDGTTLQVLTGGVANASATQGNTTASSFTWVFKNGTTTVSTVNGSQPSIPANANKFDLTVDWPGGYKQTLTDRSIVQTDLVPSFTTSPNPAIKGGTLRITNTMQKAPNTNISSVDLAFSSGNCPAAQPAFSLTLPGSFSQTIPAPFDTPAPTTEGPYCVTLRYNYTPAGGNPTSKTVSNNLTVVIASAALVANVSGPSTGTVGSALTFTANASGGTGSFTYAWDCTYNSFTGGNFQAGTATQSCTFNRNGSQTPAVRVTDTAVPPHSAIAFANVNITGGTPPPTTINASVSGPSTGSAGTPLNFTANATGGTQPYSYSWACDYSVLAGSGQFVAGTQTKACTFTGNGVHAVAARVTDSASNGAVGTASINITGLAPPSNGFGVTGATQAGTTITVGAGQPITFTANEANASTYGWAFGDTSAGTGRTITKTYPKTGTYQGQLIVTGNGNQTTGTSIASFTVQVVTPPPSGAFTVSGANPNAAGTVFTASAGEEITMTSAEPNAITWGWDFGDSTQGAARSVKKTYSQLGTYTVKLFVTGNDADTHGLVISQFTVNVVSCVTSGTTLCLNANRFRATVDWAVPDQGKSGAGSAVALTGDTGYYWFFSPTNIELVLKVVDGRTFNGNYWVFYGALSNVEYTITIKDTTTGTVKTYHNPSGTTASLADVNAFPSPATPTSKVAEATSAAITVVCTPSTVAIGQQFSCQASPANTYSWDFGEDFPPRFQPGPNPNTHSYGHAGTVRVSASPNGGAEVGSTTVVVTAGSGGVAANISGPSTATVGTAVAYTGSVTGGTGPYSYAWNCEYDASTPSFTAGVAENPCTFSAAGSRTVALRVTDSATPTPATAVATKVVSISPPAGPGLPSAAFTLEGATLNPLTGKYETEIGRTVRFTATELNAASWGWVFGDGTIGGGAAPEARSVTHAYAAGGNFAGQLLVQGDGTHTVNLNIGSIPISVLACGADAQTLCLNNGRFKVKVDWRSDSGSGAATAVPVTTDTGEFWFLSANNIELLIKVVDGSAFNGHFWVFYGALSNFEYTITVTDTTTGAVKTYHNPLGTTASLADVDAF
ncbi:MAG: PKD domain-containing protein [Acidobacteriota bacterium]